MYNLIGLGLQYNINKLIINMNYKVNTILNFYIPKSLSDDKLLDKEDKQKYINKPKKKNKIKTNNKNK